MAGLPSSQAPSRSWAHGMLCWGQKPTPVCHMKLTLRYTDMGPVQRITFKC